jgi:hypothetical protein
MSDVVCACMSLLLELGVSVHVRLSPHSDRVPDIVEGPPGVKSGKPHSEHKISALLSRKPNGNALD